MKKHLATISILNKDRKMHAQDVNSVLTKNGDIILSRLGMNLHKCNIEHCNALIVIVVESTSKELTSLTKELDKMYGIVAKISKII